jgi:hypothetical protein
MPSSLQAVRVYVAAAACCPRTFGAALCEFLPLGVGPFAFPAPKERDSRRRRAMVVSSRFMFGLPQLNNFFFSFEWHKPANRMWLFWKWPGKNTPSLLNDVARFQNCAIIQD